jgi:hypothetical protein
MPAKYRSAAAMIPTTTTSAATFKSLIGIGCCTEDAAPSGALAAATKR